jgi:hypothetical protein
MKEKNGVWKRGEKRGVGEKGRGKSGEIIYSGNSFY